MENNIQIEYHFEIKGLEKDSYLMEFEQETMSFICPNDNPPEWTLLKNNKCEHCPLNEAENRHCPIAKNISYLVSKFKDKKSHHETKVIVKTPDREYTKETSLQDGVFGAMGLIMATSGCPYFKYLRPSARFHLPFATTKETIVRSISMFLTYQYFKNPNAPFLISSLDGVLKDIAIANKGITQRLRGLSKGDTELTAITVLDSFLQMLSYEISSGFNQVEKYFQID